MNLPPISLCDALHLMHKHREAEESSDESDLDVDTITKECELKAEKTIQAAIAPLFASLQAALVAHEEVVVDFEEQNPIEELENKTIQIEKMLSELLEKKQKLKKSLLQAEHKLQQEEEERTELIQRLSQDLISLKKTPVTSAFSGPIRQMGTHVSGYIAHAKTRQEKTAHMSYYARQADAGYESVEMKQTKLDFMRKTTVFPSKVGSLKQA